MKAFFYAHRFTQGLRVVLPDLKGGMVFRWRWIYGVQIGWLFIGAIRGQQSASDVVEVTPKGAPTHE